MLVYGRNVAIEMLKKSKKIKKAFLETNFKDKMLFSLIEKSGIPVVFKDKKELDRIAKENHQGIILDVMDYQYTSVEEMISENPRFVIILDHLEDPHNLGAIIRTAEAAGVDFVIIPKDRGVSVNATVMKTSAGALENMKVVQVSNLVQIIERLKKEQFWVIGTDMENSVDYRRLDYQGKVALIIGNEGKGMSRLMKESCDFIAKIPMRGKVNSLNASVAAAIMIYEVIRNQ